MQDASNDLTKDQGETMQALVNLLSEFVHEEAKLLREYDIKKAQVFAIRQAITKTERHFADVNKRMAKKQADRPIEGGG